jgi:alpha-tubulin suppressor-like RCC1 family protein
MIKLVRLSGLLLLTFFLPAIFGMADVTWAATPRVNAGGNHTVALKSDGSLWGWGENTFGQVGDGSVISRNVPVRIGAETTWTAISAGFYHTMAIKADGTLWAWGDDTKGQLGDGSAASSQPAPVQIGTDSNWAEVAAGDFHTLARKTDGSLWAWGDNTSGQVGNGAVVPGIQAVPVRIGTATDWVAIAAGGSHSVALKGDHTLWGWGSNTAGQLGNSTNLDAAAPVPIVLPAPFINNDWTYVAAGQSNTAALKTDGSLWSWGSNTFGQLGNGTVLNSNVPVREAGGATTWVAVAAGDFHAVGRRSDGTLWAWGGNASGQLGNGTNTDALTPVRVNADTDWIDADAGSLHIVALKTDTTVWSWGDNASGQLGDGTNSAKNAPVLIPVTFVPLSPVVTASVSGGNGSISSTNPLTVASGATASFTLLPDQGFKPDSSVTGTCPAGSFSGFSYTTGIITTDCSVGFSFIPLSQPSVFINGGSPYTVSARVTLSLSAVPAPAYMQFQLNGRTWTRPEPFNPTKTVTLPLGDGLKTVGVHFMTSPTDSAPVSVSASIILDRKKPTGTILINGGARFTNSTHVTLSLTAADVNGVDLMRFSPDNKTWSSWEAFNTTREYDLPAGIDGPKRVFVQYRDKAGNISAPRSDGIILKTLAPAVRKNQN